MAFSYGGSGGGDSDYSSIFNRVFGQDRGSARLGGRGLSQRSNSTAMGMGTKVMNDMANAGRFLPLASGTNMPTLTGAEAFRLNNAIQQLPYAMQMQTAQMNNASAERIAEMNAQAQLAAELLERDNQLEIQRRNQLGEDYGTKQQYYYQYGI